MKWMLRRPVAWFFAELMDAMHCPVNLVCRLVRHAIGKFHRQAFLFVSAALVPADAFRAALGVKKRRTVAGAGS